MKRIISIVLAAVMLLTLLAACGEKPPVEPAETELYGKVTLEGAVETALGAVVSLGYYENTDDMKAELPEALKDLPIVEMGGGETYAVIPRYDGETITVYAVEMDENANSSRAESGSEYSGAILLMCNESDIFSNVSIEMKHGDDTVTFSPYISLMDGSIITDERMPVGTIQ